MQELFPNSQTLFVYLWYSVIDQRLLWYGPRQYYDSRMVLIKQSDRGTVQYSRTIYYPETALFPAICEL
jgi:hypothetical protein